jgi:predicted acetyltransferase
VPWVLDEVANDFSAYVAWLDKNSQGMDLPRGFVPNSTFWLVDSDDEIVGATNIRHTLTEVLLSFGGHIGYGVRPSAREQGYATEILRLSLIEARLIGIRAARLTCDKRNIASVKTITRNGGILDSEAYMDEHRCVIQRYWIHEAPY